MSKTSERKAKVKQALIDAAKMRISNAGVAQLRARDLATDVGCSVGAIYTIFQDLDEIILYVSLDTLNQIDRVMSASLQRTAGKVVEDRLVDLAITYCRFVNANTRAWRTLFEHAQPADRTLPSWIIDRQVDLLEHIRTPLVDMMPDATPAILLSTARLLFSAVHGVVNLSVDQRTTGLPLETVEEQLSFLVGMFVRGLEREQV